FFFSSRRRHTRFSRDWSSDVCSSDLGVVRREALFEDEPLPLVERLGELLHLLAERSLDLLLPEDLVGATLNGRNPIADGALAVLRRGGVDGDLVAGEAAVHLYHLLLGHAQPLGQA